MRGALLRDAHAAGRRILLEGAQAALLDVDFGTYPFVSSSHCGANGIASGTGLPPRAVGRIIAVAKAYITRVGSTAGPFPTLDEGPAGTHMQEQGHEYGTVTGRPRRCGWFDAVAARHVVAVNGVDSLAITKIDVLKDLDPLRICVAYEVDGERLESFPADVDLLSRCKPVYRDVPGFADVLSGVRDAGRAARRRPGLRGRPRGRGRRVGRALVGGSRADRDGPFRGVMSDPRRLPGHIAIIMDGNGRWAQRPRAWRRVLGHKP